MRLFISYAREDAALIKDIVAVLSAGGHEPWFDHRLLPGQDWQEQLLTHIRDCEAFLYALTPRSVESEWCMWEFGEAVKLGKSVIPLLLKRTPLPEVLDHRQVADLTGGLTAEATAKLMGGLTEIALTIPRRSAPRVREPQGIPARVDEKYTDALALAQQQGKISAAQLQRELHIGRDRAKRLVEMLVERGIVGAYAPGLHGYPLL